jgi:glutamine synthetase
MNKSLELNPNKVVAFLGKPAKEFTKADIINYITSNSRIIITCGLLNYVS